MKSWGRTWIDNDNPCKDCTKRYLHCHSECQDYIDWSKAQKKKNHEIYVSKEIDGYSSARRTKILKAIKNGKKGGSRRKR